MEQRTSGTEKAEWLNRLGFPENYEFQPSLERISRFEHPEFIGEWYTQANGPDTTQRVLLLLPKNAEKSVPGVVVPFYFPEAMLGFDPATGETLPSYAGIAMMLHLVRRGYAVVSADAYHLTYASLDLTRSDFLRWKLSAEALLRDHPRWTGMGKLVHDTFLLTDVLANDPRVDSGRLGIAGHSLGGKMAFYNGCLDERIRVILASDFGIGWDQTNWSDLWYWGEKVEDLKAAGVDHSQLLGCTGGKPFCLLAGQYDNADSWEMMKSAPGYGENDCRLKIVNHQTGHRPPWDVLCQGYDFLDSWLKGQGAR